MFEFLRTRWLNMRSGRRISTLDLVFCTHSLHEIRSTFSFHG